MLERIGWLGIMVLGAIGPLGTANALPNLIAITPQAAAAPAESPAASPTEQPPAEQPSTGQPSSETKRALTRQLLEMTGGRQQYQQMQQLFIVQMQQQIPVMIDQMVDNERLSPEQQQAMKQNLNANLNALITEFGAALQTEVTYDEMLERVYYPVYDQYFTEADLRGLIAFYRTPVGEKLLTVSPQLMQTSMQLSNQVFMPRMMQILDRLMQQQAESVPHAPATK